MARHNDLGKTALPRINFVGSLCRKLCRNTPLFLQNSTKFTTKAADKGCRQRLPTKSLRRWSCSNRESQASFHGSRYVTSSHALSPVPPANLNPFGSHFIFCP